MFVVLLNLMNLCLRSVFAPIIGSNQPAALINTEQFATLLVANVQPHTLAPIHAPTLRHLV